MDKTQLAVTLRAMKPAVEDRLRDQLENLANELAPSTEAKQKQLIQTVYDLGHSLDTAPYYDDFDGLDDDLLEAFPEEVYVELDSKRVEAREAMTAFSEARYALEEAFENLQKVIDNHEDVQRQKEENNQ